MPARAQTEDGQPAWRPIGRYELGPRLAAGGMAELYVARSSGVHGFQKYFALKRILPRFTDDREFVEMFLDEARLAAQLDHPNVVHVHDIGEDADGPFFTMDYLHGQSLLAIIRRQRTRGSLLPLDALVALGSAAAAGLHHAHERRGFDGKPLGIIHRDVSPTNILVTYEGVVKIVDFGIAKASTSRHSTRPSVRKGKMAYMSPEQCKGEALDRKSDVFALGVVLYELAILTRAFTGEGEFAVMNQIVNHDLPPASSRRPELPAELDRILGRALARDPAARYGSARELQRELDEFAVDQGLLATPDALAGLMEELFGVTPYPWEALAEDGASETSAAERGDDDTNATASTPTTARPAAATSVTSAKPMPAEPPPARAATHPRRGRAWVMGGLAAGVLGSIAWMVVPRGGAASSSSAPTDPTEPTEPTEPPAKGPHAPEDPKPPRAIAATPPPAATAPTTPSAGSTAPPTEAAAPPTEAAPPPSEPAPPAKTTRRTSKGERPRATSSPSTTTDAKPSPTLPAPFDPDAPAPRVR